MSAADRWHSLPVTELRAALGTDLTAGLTAQQAHARLVREGANELKKGEVASPWAIFASQFQSLVIWVLIGAAGISALLGELADRVAILAIVVLNAIIGFVQEYRAERAVAALARLAAPRARVVRDGRATVLAAAQVVRGDVLLLEAGDLVAADARLVEATALRTSEAPWATRRSSDAVNWGTNRLRSMQTAWVRVAGLAATRARRLLHTTDNTTTLRDRDVVRYVRATEGGGLVVSP